MATTYTWTITNLYTIDASATEPDYVVTALYLVTGTDGTYSAELSNSAQFEVKASETGFTPYADLTETQVLYWITDQLGEDGVNNLYACIQGQIDSQINPPQSPENTPLPWVTP
jgi:hypothetical protein